METESKTLYVDADEIMRDWGVCKSMAYKIIRDLSAQLKKENPKYLIIPGKINRLYYEECCRISRDKGAR